MTSKNVTRRTPFERGGRSRVTGGVRILLALWLIVSAVITFADPQTARNQSNIEFGALLPLAGLSFTLGVFLLTGFMSRVCGLLLVCIGAWQVSLGLWPPAVVEIPVGLYLMLRGGGAWAMDIYVQKMQDRVRQRELRSRESA
jgi:hypothetical protein